MRLDLLTLAFLLGATTTSALPNVQGGSNLARDGHGSWGPPAPAPSPPVSHDKDCGDKCGGSCGDKIVQGPQEECDLGPELNGKPGSGCTADCKKCAVPANFPLTLRSESDLDSFDHLDTQELGLDLACPPPERLLVEIDVIVAITGKKARALTADLCGDSTAKTRTAFSQERTPCSSYSYITSNLTPIIPEPIYSYHFCGNLTSSSYRKIERIATANLRMSLPYSYKDAFRKEPEHAFSHVVPPSDPSTVSYFSIIAHLLFGTLKYLVRGPVWFRNHPPKMIPNREIFANRFSDTFGELATLDCACSYMNKEIPKYFAGAYIFPPSDKELVAYAKSKHAVRGVDAIYTCYQYLVEYYNRAMTKAGLLTSRDGATTVVRQDRLKQEGGKREAVKLESGTNLVNLPDGGTSTPARLCITKTPQDVIDLTFSSPEMQPLREKYGIGTKRVISLDDESDHEGVSVDMRKLKAPRTSTSSKASSMKQNSVAAAASSRRALLQSAGSTIRESSTVSTRSSGSGQLNDSIHSHDDEVSLSAESIAQFNDGRLTEEAYQWADARFAKLPRGCDVKVEHASHPQKKPECVARWISTPEISQILRTLAVVFEILSHIHGNRCVVGGYATSIQFVCPYCPRSEHRSSMIELGRLLLVGMGTISEPKDIKRLVDGFGDNSHLCGIDNCMVPTHRCWECHLANDGRKSCHHGDQDSLGFCPHYPQCLPRQPGRELFCLSQNAANSFDTAPDGNLRFKWMTFGEICTRAQSIRKLALVQETRRLRDGPKSRVSGQLLEAEYRSYKVQSLGRRAEPVPPHDTHVSNPRTFSNFSEDHAESSDGTSGSLSIYKPIAYNSKDNPVHIAGHSPPNTSKGKDKGKGVDRSMMLRPRKQIAYTIGDQEHFYSLSDIEDIDDDDDSNEDLATIDTDPETNSDEGITNEPNSGTLTDDEEVRPPVRRTGATLIVKDRDDAKSLEDDHFDMILREMKTRIEWYDREKHLRPKDKNWDRTLKNSYKYYMFAFEFHPFGCFVKNCKSVRNLKDFCQHLMLEHSRKISNDQRSELRGWICKYPKCEETYEARESLTSHIKSKHWKETE